MADANFRITQTDYIFELFNPLDEKYYKAWVSGSIGTPVLCLATSPDLDGVAIEFDKGDVPEGGLSSSNYRITVNNVFQLKNVDTGLWHTLYINGEAGHVAFAIALTGEE